MGKCIPVQGAKDLGSSHISAKDLPWNLANATRTHPAWPPGLHWYHERLAHVKLKALCRPLLLHPPAGCVLPPTFPQPPPQAAFEDLPDPHSTGRHSVLQQAVD